MVFFKIKFSKRLLKSGKTSYYPMKDYLKEIQMYLVYNLNRKLEEQILAQPEYWLWTHKRWKRKRRENELSK